MVWSLNRRPQLRGPIIIPVSGGTGVYCYFQDYAVDWVRWGKYVGHVLRSQKTTKDMLYLIYESPLERMFWVHLSNSVRHVFDLHEHLLYNTCAMDAGRERIKHCEWQKKKSLFYMMRKIQGYPPRRGWLIKLHSWRIVYSVWLSKSKVWILTGTAFFTILSVLYLHDNFCSNGLHRAKQLWSPLCYIKYIPDVIISFSEQIHYEYYLMSVVYESRLSSE